MARVIKLTHETLLKVLDYDPETGIFTWKVARSNRVKIGSRAGVFHHQSGGRYISIDNEKFMSHRLAWFYVHGEPTKLDIRPLDGNYDNAAISNLKEISRVELQHQRGANKNNESGYLGVSRAKFNRWQASVTWNYKQIHLGADFDTPEEASEVYIDAVESLKAASPETVSEIVKSVRLRRRHRSAWRYLEKNFQDHDWTSFEHFQSTVTEFHRNKMSMVPLDLSRPIGPTNYKWALPLDTTHSTKDGMTAYVRAKREGNRNWHRGMDFKRNYGITYPEYEAMLLAQKGVCAICDKPETKLENGSIRLLSVDHNHTTKAVRGLLCANCNLAIGYACDDTTILTKAIAYLEKHKTPDNVVQFEPAAINGALSNGN